MQTAAFPLVKVMLSVETVRHGYNDRTIIICQIHDATKLRRKVSSFDWWQAPLVRIRDKYSIEMHTFSVSR